MESGGGLRRPPRRRKKPVRSPSSSSVCLPARREQRERGHGATPRDPTRRRPFLDQRRRWPQRCPPHRPRLHLLLDVLLESPNPDASSLIEPPTTGAGVNDSAMAASGAASTATLWCLFFWCEGKRATFYG
ncbi:unnamed protein product [Urochloa humidicola]